MAVTKLNFISMSCVVLLSAQIALSEEPQPVNGQALGMMEGILDKCAQVDTKAAADYRQRVAMLTQGASEDAVAEIRQSDEYKRSYASITESLAQVSEPEVMQACNYSLAGNR